MKKINTALIGRGYWGSKLERYIKENPNFNLEYICDSKSDLEEVWRNPEINAVVVATPNETHYSIVKSALLHDKNVLSEKPLALHTTECEELKQIASNRNLQLLVDYTYTFSKGLEKAKAIIKRGKIGELRGLEMSVRHLGRFGGGNVYWLLGSHMLSVLDMFVPLKDLKFEKNDLVIYKGEVETGVISFENEKVSGQIIVSLNYPGKESKAIFYGERGSIIYNPLSQPSLQIENYERIPWTIGSKLTKEHKDYEIDESNNLRYAIKYFNKVIRGKAESNIDRAVQITKILEKIQN